MEDNIILYHGTNTQFNKIDVKKFKKFKDFGEGFYLTPNFEQAYDFANNKVKYFGGKKSINKYEIPKEIIKKLNILNLNKETVETWLGIICINRKIEIYGINFDESYYKNLCKNNDIIIGKVFDNNFNKIIENYNTQKINNIKYLINKLQMLNYIQYRFSVKAVKDIDIDKYLVKETGGVSLEWN